MPCRSASIQNKIMTGTPGATLPDFNHAVQACPAYANKRAISHGFYRVSCISLCNKLPSGFPAVIVTSFIAVIAKRVAAFRHQRRHITTFRPQLGYRELTDIGIYRGHIDRVASAENEAF